MSSPPQRPSVTAELDAAIGADRALMLQHLRREHRGAFEALWAVDAVLGDVVARSTQPALGRIKLAWWREELERLDAGAPPAEPRLRAVADHLLPLRITGADLGGLEMGWATLLDEEPDPALVGDRGALLFRIGGRILGAQDDRLAQAGSLYAFVAVARRGVPGLLASATAPAAAVAGHRFPRALRVLTGLARLAARDLEQGAPFEPEGTAARAAAMLRHRWSGIVTRAR